MYTTMSLLSNYLLFLQEYLLDIPMHRDSLPVTPTMLQIKIVVAYVAYVPFHVRHTKF